MSKIQHGTVGTVSTPNNIQPNQHYVVDDPTLQRQYQQPAQQQFVPMNANNMPSLENLQAQKRLVEQQEAKKNGSKLLENLIFLGRAEKVVEVGDVKFTLSTLTNKENTEIMQELYSLEDNSNVWVIRTLTLAQSLKKINDVEIKDLQLEEQFTNLFKKKIYIIDQLQGKVLDKLMEAYETLDTESAKSVTGEEIKK